MLDSDIHIGEEDDSDGEGVAENSFMTSALLRAVREIEELENENGQVENGEGLYQSGGEDVDDNTDSAEEDDAPIAIDEPLGADVSNITSSSNGISKKKNSKLKVSSKPKPVVVIPVLGSYFTVLFDLVLLLKVVPQFHLELL